MFDRKIQQPRITISQAIANADKLFNKEKYFAAYDAYEAIYHYLIPYEAQFTAANEIVWCKSMMYTCKRFTSTVSTTQAIIDLYDLEQDLKKYGSTLKPSDTDQIRDTISKAKKYYEDATSCANADYCYAVNVKTCLDPKEKNKNKVAIKKLMALSDQPEQLAKQVNIALGALKIVTKFYKRANDIDQHNVALDLSASLYELMAGIKRGVKRPLNESGPVEDIHNDSNENQPEKKKIKLDLSGYQRNNMYQSNDSTSESNRLSSENSRPMCKA